ncbi:MAG: hypothetical protein HZC38_05395 [Chloroflexi bacterium]|nr:hypothetical protein [Chloroflexota bacterium]
MQTLQLKRPSVSVILWSALFFLILGLLSEAALRVAHAAQVLPAPNMGAANPELGIKVARLDALAKAKGKIDCIFIGSSAVDADVDPQEMSRIYQTRTGEEIGCFNFGIAAMPATATPVIGKFLIARYHPMILIFGADPSVFSQDFPGGVYDVPWVRYHAGDVSLEGWLMEYSFLYRYSVASSDWRNVERIELTSRLERNISSFGFNAYKGDEFEEVITGWGMAQHQLYPPYFASYRDFLSLRSTGTQIVVFELPTQMNFRVNKDAADEKAYQEQFLQPIIADAESRGALFWRTGQLVFTTIPANHFADWLHLNRRGKDVFSRWLGEQLAQEVQQGKLKVR